MRNLLIGVYSAFVLFELFSISLLEVVGNPNYSLEYSYVIFFNFVLQTIVIYKVFGLINFLYAFVAFYYVFHFGQVLMMGFFPWYEYDYMNYILTYMTRSPSLIKDTLDLCIHCINLFVLGALFVRPGEQYNGFKTNRQIDYRRICKYMFCTLFLIRLISDAVRMVAAYRFGYHGTFGGGLGGVFSALATMAYGVIPLYYLSIEDQKYKKRFLVFIVSYLLITMLTGHRGHQMTCLVGLGVVYLSQRKITPYRFLGFLLLGILGLQFLDIVFDMRGDGIDNFFNNYGKVVNNVASKNIILETIGTFGETIYTPFLVFESRDLVNPFWGECFVKSIVSIAPDVTGAFKDVNNEAVFAKMVANEHTIGGSFAGEMFYNFGYTYYIPTVILGYFYSKLSNIVSYQVKRNQIEQICISLPVCVLLIWWIRDGVGNMTREVVWIMILFYSFKKILPKKYVKSIANIRRP